MALRLSARTLRTTWSQVRSSSCVRASTGPVTTSVAPSRIRSLVFELSAIHPQAEALERAAELADSLPWPENVWMGVSVEHAETYDRAGRRPTDRIAQLRFVQDIPLQPSDQAWPLVDEAGRRLTEFADRPTLIGWGLQDFVFDRHFLDGFRRALPNAEVHPFDDASHYVLEDKHRELVPLMRAFLDRNPL